ncbi:RsmB/NOP family class I SAM-dependent RNA methyltransferase [Pedobacter faecalis]|uniref:RsmB/NOP family class I SAM-dependent RNA methyltransferase n=1 Tax=Pedobacter faecalis TaxID=3041495 RepID=UPI00254F73D3|nr:RsmB/NOP family class I SAM-dependent RNA methyltransferase [Pedobacter sp. ELA7]
MKIHHQLRAFQQILERYQGDIPLHRFLFGYYKQNKQMGSSDRRWATRYIYSYFRLGNALATRSQNLRLAVADFLCNDTPSLIVESELPFYVDQMKSALHDKFNLLTETFPDFNLQDVFRFQEHLSAGVDRAAFAASHFIQPDLFIRVKRSYMPQVLNELLAHEVPFRELSETTVALPNGTKLEQILTDQALFEVQDLSSQETGKYFEPGKWEYWWDCCAASGGKSLLLHDSEPTVQLLVSDLRSSSLDNLEERFRAAGIKTYQKKVLDLLQNNEQVLHHYEFDGIILDAPCSGSGTWGRTPEMLHYFDANKIEAFAALQRAIATNVCKYLKAGAPLIYITCSAFMQENETSVKWLTENLPLSLEKAEVIKGYDHKADTMFVARLIKTEA